MSTIKSELFKLKIIKNIEINNYRNLIQFWKIFKEINY